MATPDQLVRRLTVAEVAEVLAVNQAKVIGWIRSGELRAIDVSVKRGARPRWRIAPSDLAAFETSRAAVPTPKVVQRKRHRTHFTEFV